MTTTSRYEIIATPAGRLNSRMDPTRSTICECCPAFRRGQVHAETWCARFDDQPGEERNCEGQRHQRWKARVASNDPRRVCRQWMDAASCPPTGHRSW
jgi:hypothetical protein